MYRRANIQEMWTRVNATQTKNRKNQHITYCNNTSSSYFRKQSPCSNVLQYYLQTEVCFSVNVILPYYKQSEGLEICELLKGISFKASSREAAIKCFTAVIGNQDADAITALNPEEPLRFASCLGRGLLCSLSKLRRQNWKKFQNRTR